MCTSAFFIYYCNLSKKHDIMYVPVMKCPIYIKNRSEGECL